MPRFLAVLLLLLASAACTAAEGAQQEEYVLRIWPEKPVVKYGDSMVLNCSSNCENIGLETSLQAVASGTGPTWKAFNFTSVTEWEPNPLCFATCGGTEPKYQRITTTVYRAPERVVLDPLPEVEVGKEYNVTCRVFSVAPIRNLTVTLYKGKKRLYVETFEDHRNPEAGNVVVTSNSITAQHNDHVTCHTALDLRPEGPYLEMVSLSKLLETVVFPMDPYLRTLGSVEINTSMPVECEVSGLFPVQKATFQLFFAGERLNSSNHISGHNVSAQAQVSSISAGEHQLICTVSLGPVTKTAESTVKVYSLPKPSLHIDHPQIPVNTNVTVMCRSDGFKSSGVVMRISDTKEILLSGDGPSLQYSLTAHKEDNGRQFMCKVELKVDGRLVVKETSANLTVFYAPQMSDSSCPDKLTWKDSSEETFICSASGNPPPTVECRKDEVLYNIGIQQQVTKEHGGIYHCNATNTYGFDVRYVTIHVECGAETASRKTPLKMDFGLKFLNGIRAIYSQQTAKVIVNNVVTEEIKIEKGTRQGCPLSPLLFISILEVLLNRLRQEEEVAGVKIGSKQYKLKAFADDVVLTLQNPETSATKALEIMTEFDQVAGFRLNKEKTKILEKKLTIQERSKIETATGLKFVKKVKYLGVNLTSKNLNLYKDNYEKVWKEIKKDLEIWSSLKLSMLGRIATIKMNVLPRMLFLFQSIPIIDKNVCFKEWQTAITRFIWQGKKPRIKYKILTDVKERGGFALPDLKIYYEAACFCWLKDWILLENTDVLDLEGFNNIFGWHAYLWYDKIKAHSGFKNHIIRKSLFKVWTKYKDLLVKKTPRWLSPIEAKTHKRRNMSDNWLT